jgi:hypothetical protein
MRRIACLVVVCWGLPLGGCGIPGWFRSVGHFPGVAPSDYAFYRYWATSSQLYQFPVPQVAMSAREALGDFGFKVVRPPRNCPDGTVFIDALTPDGRSAEVTITPQNNLTNMRIKIGPVCVGDEMLSRDVFKRVAVNFGTSPRNYTPLEPVLERRINHPPGMALQEGFPRYETLLGEGLRPGETRGTTGEEENQGGPQQRPNPILYGTEMPNWYTSPPIIPFLPAP